MTQDEARALACFEATPHLSSCPRARKEWPVTKATPCECDQPVRAMLAFRAEALPAGHVAVPREVVEPFAAVADEYGDGEDDHYEVWQDAGPQRLIRASFRLGNYRALREALSAAPPSPDRLAEAVEALRKIAEHDGVSYRFGDEVRAIANAALTSIEGPQEAHATRGGE